MKTTFFTLILALTFVQAFAADINVDATGAVPGSYPTIAAGIAAASDGDRVVIFSNGVIYKESFTIDKTLTFLTPVQGDYFFVEGDITVTPVPGREIVMIGMSQEGNILSGGDNAIGTRCSVTIVDCRVIGGIRFPNGGYDVNVLYSEIFFDVQITHGKIIANKIGLEHVDDEQVWGEIDIVTESASFGGIGDTLYIIANLVTKGNQNIAYMPVSFNNPNARYFMANNSFRNSPATTSGFSHAMKTVQVVACYEVDSANLFMNNFVMGYYNSSCGASSTLAAVELRGISDENIINNHFYNRLSPGNRGCAMISKRGNYNLLSGFELPNVAFDNNVIDHNRPADSVDKLTGKLNAGAGIDQGKPGAPYMDLDLTRNDMGTFGGPYSWDNYWDTTSATGHSRVFLLDIPSNIYSITAPTTIKASSTHTK